MQSFSQLSASPRAHIPPVAPCRKMVERVHKRLSESFFRMLLRIRGVSAKELPTVSIAAPYHALVTLPAVAAQTLEVLLYEICCLIFVLKHRGKFLQKFGFTVFSLAFGFGKSLFELLQFFALFGLFPPSPLPVRAFRMRYRYPVATIIINLCRE